jgi:hypothetical protein
MGRRLEGRLKKTLGRSPNAYHGLGRANQRHEPPGPIGKRHSPETSRKGRRFVGTPAGIDKVSREDYSMAASSFIRWGGSAAILGGLSTTFVWGLLPPPSSPNEGE